MDIIKKLECVHLLLFQISVGIRNPELLASCFAI